MITLLLLAGQAQAQTGLCCQAGGNGTPGCNNAACQAAVCALDPFCCNVTWDGLCSTAAINNANGGGACAGVTSCPGGGGGGPVNNLCGNATVIFTGTTPFSTIGATGTDISTCGANDANDVWYQWTATCTGTATASTCNNATFDTVLSAWSACGGAQLACNDDAAGCGLTSTITWAVTTGVTYWIRVSGYNLAVGTGSLTISCSSSPPPANACCSPNGTPGCDNAACQAAICALDFFCCAFLWDALCSGAAITNANAGGVCAGVSNCPGTPPTPNTCCTANSTPGCESAACQVAICSADPFCCNNVWDAICAAAAVANANASGPCAGVSNCPGTPGGGGGCAPAVAGGALPGSGSILIQQNLTPTQLIQDVFLGECLTASNVQFTGSTAAIGTFTNGWRIGINSGIVLTTGNAALAAGPNWADGTGQDNLQPGYNLLTALAGIQTYDAAVFQFTFVPQTNQVTFKYVFGSDEYPEYVCSNFNDVFGFFVTGPGYAPNTNIATIPGSALPVAINTVNPGVSGIFGFPGGCASLAYSSMYVNNPLFSPHNEYDGFTVPLTACINTVPCETYTIIIAVADAFDGVLDSAVFLEAESFSAGVDLQIDATADQVTVSDEDNCVDYGYFIFTLDQPLGQDVTLNYTIDQIGDAVYDPPIPLQVTFPAGQTTVIISVNAIPASLGPDVSSVTINLDTSQNPLLGCSCTSEYVSTTLYFCDNSILPVTWLGFEASNIHEEREVLCAWNTATELNSDHFTVQRSADMVSWIDIGTVPGAGTTAMAQSYEFVDRAPLSGVSYYRIRQTDHDGTSAHSEVRSVSRGATTRLGVYPNPGAGLFQLSGHEGGVLTVFDPRGRRIPFTLGQAGELGLHGVAAGVYLLELRRGGDPPERLRLVVR
ncbi:MAG: T9SS type A sorting domain-containing protein [Flavobacteriales bacterium]|nr:T9SS type A sorting domain-containing protein [Flavobacteriales bacterium]